MHSMESHTIHQSYTSLPGNFGGVDVKADELADFLWCEGGWIRFTDAQTLQTQITGRRLYFTEVREG